MTGLRSRLFLPLVAALVLAACGEGEPAATQPAAGSAAPSDQQPAASAAVQVVAFPQLQQQLSGKPVLYLFTATGCASCAAEAAQVEQAVQKHPGVSVVGVDVVPQDSPSALQSFLQQAGVTSPRLVWTIDTQSVLVHRFDVANLDTTVGSTAADGFGS